MRIPVAVFLGLILSACNSFNNQDPATKDGAGIDQTGLIALYTFTGSDNTLFEDSSALEPLLPLHAAVAAPTQTSLPIEFLEPQGIYISAPVHIASDKAASKIIERVMATNAISLEVWIQPENATQAGPARIVSISTGTLTRNLTLGQQGGDYIVRMKTTEGTGQPQDQVIASKLPSFATELTQVVFTWDSNSQQAWLYIDGGRYEYNATVSGDLSNWNVVLPLTLANEVDADRPWLGALYEVAFYDRVLTRDEIAANFLAK